MKQPKTRWKIKRMRKICNRLAYWCSCAGEVLYPFFFKKNAERFSHSQASIHLKIHPKSFEKRYDYYEITETEMED